MRLASKAKLSALVRDAVELAEARQRVDQSRLAMMRAFAETDGCRRQFLLGYFGEDLPAPCGNCDACSATAQADGAHSGKEQYDGGAAASDADQPFPPQSAVVHKEWGPGLVMRQEGEVMTVLFDQDGY